MCVLCDRENLRLLVAPLPSLTHRQLADSISVAREAAWQLVLDTADAITEDDESDVSSCLGPDGYIDYVIERAERDGELRHDETIAWNDALRDGSIFRDPRVQSFLASAAEGLATYILQIRAHKEALALFLEERNGGVVFAGVGANGEIVFDRGAERYVVLNDDEALRIAMDRIATNLCKEDPRWLLEFTNLPIGAADVLAAMQQGPPERANDILAGIVDLEALTEDRVRQIGYAPFVAEGVTDEFSEQRFGDRIVIRLRVPEKPLSLD
ncbi:MAG: hypothetical protein GEU90_10855 [Gemmatimonas sp.]|nr:hypothetical protein [Gemmatimonas sp.]